jgi:GntR family transcriptional regulator
MEKRAKYLVLADALEEQIFSMGQNSLLPTEQQLSKRFQLSRVTVRRSLAFLERKGLLSRERGRGTIVNSPKITRHLLPVSTIEQDLHDHGLILETRICEWQPEIMPPDHIRTRLQLEMGESVAFLSLVRVVDNRVICHDRRYFPPALGRRFDPQLVTRRAVSHILQDLTGLGIESDTWETEITPASYEVAKHLGIVPGVLVLVNTFTHYFQKGQPAEAGVMSYRIDRVKFEFAASGRV